MFVSSYSTFINTQTADKTHKEKATPSQKGSYSRLATQELQNISQNETSKTTKTQLPLNYISDYKVLNNQYKLLQESQSTQESKNKSKFTKISTLQSAQDAYVQNSTLFASLKKPKVALAQMPLLNAQLPQESLKAQENILKITMVNTYIANDNYYKITA